jgi:hypothetical protein
MWTSLGPVGQLMLVGFALAISSVMVVAPICSYRMRKFLDPEDRPGRGPGGARKQRSALASSNRGRRKKQRSGRSEPLIDEGGEAVKNPLVAAPYVRQTFLSPVNPDPRGLRKAVAPVTTSNPKRSGKSPASNSARRSSSSKSNSKSSSKSPSKSSRSKSPSRSSSSKRALKADIEPLPPIARKREAPIARKKEKLDEAVHKHVSSSKKSASSSSKKSEQAPASSSSKKSTRSGNRAGSRGKERAAQEEEERVAAAAAAAAAEVARKKSSSKRGSKSPAKQPSSKSTSKSTSKSNSKRSSTASRVRANSIESTQSTKSSYMF